MTFPFFKLLLGDRIELDLISHPEISRRIMAGIKHLDRSPAQKLPPSGTLHRIDPGLLLGNGHRPCGNGKPGCL